jgi:hypothetical protein
VNEKVLTRQGRSHQIKYTIGHSGRSTTEIAVRTPPKHECSSLVQLITRPEESLFVNEEVLTHYELSHRIK